MPLLRTVACPSCHTPRETKAAGGTRLRCDECGAFFAAGSAEPVTPDGQTDDQRQEGPGGAAGAAAAGDDGTAPPSTPEPAVKPSAPGVKVVKASGTKVRRTAKPRPSNKPPAKPPAKKAAAPVAKAEKPAEAPKAQERAKLAGRRGGLGYYSKMRRAG